jgi:CheY-like chemotaxis protein
METRNGAAVDILLVDDNSDFLMPMKEALYQRGYNVYAADDGLQASKVISATSVDLIISDIKMPNMDGIQLFELVRGLKRYAPTKFLFISGYKEVYEDQLQLNPENDFFLDKTAAPQEIVRFIDRLMFGKFAEVWV